MKIAINQPTYLPWAGYFDLIDQADLFVLLDNVQFAKQSWQQRNRIRTAAGLQWLSVPVAFRGHFGQLIKDVEIRDPNFCHDQIRAIELAYRRAPHFAKYFPALKQRLQELSNGLLVDLNIGLIRLLMDFLRISTPLVRASTLNVNGRRTELLANICERVGASEYLSPLGSAVYLLEEQEILCARGITIFFQNYEHPQYPQLYAPFEAFASVIDLIFNCGENALAILRRGRREPYSAAQLAHLQTAANAANVLGRA
ncbi:MAG TPA: WbqC family protein [Terriglobales bacterium]|nr:WbqC family protein [Terriglobales bacterium]